MIGSTQWQGRRAMSVGVFICAALGALASQTCRADLLVSSNDGHTELKDGQLLPSASPRPDTLTVVDVANNGYRVLSTTDMPGSVIGPPMSVWVSPDESWGIVTASSKIGNDTPKKIVPNDEVAVFSLGGEPTGAKATITQRLPAGAGATTVRLSPDGRYAVIPNRNGGSVSFFRVDGHTLTPFYTIDIGKDSGTNGAVFLKDSRTVLVTVQNQNRVAVLHIDGDKVVEDKRSITTGLAPLTIDVNSDRTLAAVSNMGRGAGDVDTVSLIDLTSAPYRTVDTASVPSGPEPMKFSPDGRFLAVGSENGSSKGSTTPFYHTYGYLSMFAVNHGHLSLVAQAQSGAYLEGLAFSRDGSRVYVQENSKNLIWVYGWNGSQLNVMAKMPTPTGPSALVTAWP
ncbi:MULTISPECIES: YncE family protein [Paraburkholderia]|uniref:YncE family protein n=1 Tax=Paraburkholderia TaxID=1822464 RepID=UPI002AB72220|nr:MULTISPECIES: beta-propeller fold lactonase family protein [Paraburkholderia]